MSPTRKVSYRKWEFDCDQETTRQIYEAVSKRLGRGDLCNCQECRNFFKLRDSKGVYPNEVMSLLRELGINHRLETELLHVGEANPGRHRCAVYFSFVGFLKKGPDAHLERIDKDFQIALSRQARFVFEEFKNHHIVEIELVVDVPWVLTEDNSSRLD